MDLEDGCVGPAPYYIPHFKVYLENRKGWQKKRDMTAQERVRLMAITLAEQRADAVKTIYMIFMNRISLKLI
jgi:hypothetical protein